MILEVRSKHYEGQIWSFVWGEGTFRTRETARPLRWDQVWFVWELSRKLKHGGKRLGMRTEGSSCLDPEEGVCHRGGWVRQGRERASIGCSLQVSGHPHSASMSWFQQLMHAYPFWYSTHPMFLFTNSFLELFTYFDKVLVGICIVKGHRCEDEQYALKYYGKDSPNPVSFSTKHKVWPYLVGKHRR